MTQLIVVNIFQSYSKKAFSPKTVHRSTNKIVQDDMVYKIVLELLNPYLTHSIKIFVSRVFYVKLEIYKWKLGIRYLMKTHFPGW